jgi:cyclomaltodextrinase / maltogenic alpha-amylase / neopullulanase
VGLSQHNDVRAADGNGGLEQSRLPMLWGAEQDAELHDYYRRLMQLRRAHPALWRATRTTLLADDARGLYIYQCDDRMQLAVVALNVSDEPQTVELPGLPARRLVLGSEASVAWDGARVNLPSWAGAILLATAGQATRGG